MTKGSSSLKAQVASTSSQAHRQCSSRSTIASAEGCLEALVMLLVGHSGVNLPGDIQFVTLVDVGKISRVFTLADLIVRDSTFRQKLPRSAVYELVDSSIVKGVWTWVARDRYTSLTVSSKVLRDHLAGHRNDVKESTKMIKRPSKREVKEYLCVNGESPEMESALESWQQIVDTKISEASEQMDGSFFEVFGIFQDDRDDMCQLFSDLVGARSDLQAKAANGE